MSGDNYSDASVSGVQALAAIINHSKADVASLKRYGETIGERIEEEEDGKYARSEAETATRVSEAVTRISEEAGTRVSEVTRRSEDETRREEEEDEERRRRKKREEEEEEEEKRERRERDEREEREEREREKEREKENDYNNSLLSRVFASNPSYSGVGAGDDLEKQNVLLDIARLKSQGVRFSREWNMTDPLEDMQFELRRISLHQEELNNVGMMRDGMRFLCTAAEMLSTKFNLLDLDGWASEVCSDMQKYDPALAKIYRKYWRRSYVSSPEMEITLGIVSSMAMFHFKKKLTSRMFMPSMKGGQPGSSPEDDVSDAGSEELPP